MTKKIGPEIFHPKCFGPKSFWTYIFLVDLKIPNTKPITKEPSLVNTRVNPNFLVKLFFQMEKKSWNQMNTIDEFINHCHTGRNFLH